MQVDNLEATIMSDERTENKEERALKGKEENMKFTLQGGREEIW